MGGKKSKIKLTQARLEELLCYNPETGIFKWKKAGRGRKNDGTVGCLCANRYLIASVDSNYYYVHRLAWLYVYGEFPPQQTDHINGIRHDNRICNLRAVTGQENARNVSMSRRNTSGRIGVYWNKQRKRWRPAIEFCGKNIYLGSFLSKEDAIKARREAEKKYGFHPNHGHKSKNYE